MLYEIEGLTFSYPGSQRTVLQDVSLQLQEGEILCILGPNGAGKTTLLGCMAGLLQPQQGRISLCGRNLAEMTPRQIAQMVGYVPQLHTPAFDYRVLDFVLMGRSPQMGMFDRPKAGDEALARSVLQSMGIGHLAEVSYRNISGGERQQALIARAMVQQPRAVLFDEPTAHLDYGNQHRVLQRIRQMAAEDFSVVITTHNPDHALLLGGSAAIVDRDGRVCQGPGAEILTEARLRQIYGIGLRLIWAAELGRMVCLSPGLEEERDAVRPGSGKEGQDAQK